jgi:hypothetical protein
MIFFLNPSALIYVLPHHNAIHFTYFQILNVKKFCGILQSTVMCKECGTAIFSQFRETFHDINFVAALAGQDTTGILSTPLPFSSAAVQPEEERRLPVM